MCIRDRCTASKQTYSTDELMPVDVEEYEFTPEGIKAFANNDVLLSCCATLGEHTQIIQEVTHGGITVKSYLAYGKDVYKRQVYNSIPLHVVLLYA